jgi:AraC-like DNA-binding protein
MDMEFDFSLTKDPGIVPKLGLTAVYKEYTDSTYVVKRYDADRSGCIALRTTRGRGSVTIEGHGAFELFPESLIIFDQRYVTEYSCISDVWNVWWFEFNQDGSLELPMNKMLPINFVSGEAEDCEACLEFLRINNPYENMMASARFSVLLLKWIIQSQEKPRPFIPHKASVERVIRLMKSKLSVALTVKKMADEAGLSERRFRCVFEAVTGLQPKKYYDLIRLGAAEELLSRTPFSMEEISDSLGFSSQFHFSNFFKKNKGLSPAAYRNKWPAGNEKI